MISKLFLASIFLAAGTFSFAQGPMSDVLPSDPPAAKKTVKAEPAQTLPDPYVRPTGKRRMKNYLNSIAGPAALVQYVAAPAMLTAFNSPEEWGGKWEGFGKRVANTVGKNLIRNTTTYGLDEAFKVDSNFYRSKDRSFSAKVKNSLLSSVTARNKDGKRVIGIPRIAGSFVSEIVSSVAWFPPKNDLARGFRGGAISLGINAGFNLFREFIFKK